MDSFNDKSGKINFSIGQYRVLQVVLREKLVGKESPSTIYLSSHLILDNLIRFMRTCLLNEMLILL
jgi:hypothetical protein